MPRYSFLSMGLLSMLLIMVSVKVYAQTDKQITNIKAIGIGYTSLQDTYLSPEHYNGIEVRYLSHTLREHVDSLHQEESTLPMRRIINEGTFSRTKTCTGNGSTLAGYYHFEYGMLWHCVSLLNNNLHVHVGGQGELLGGFIYNTRNGNNPAQARALINIGGAVHADYIINRKMSIAYDASVPLVGLTFSPNYGQSYYEIFDRGNYDHNIVATTIGSMPSLRHQLALTYRLRNYGLTVGYLGDYRQQAVNSLKQHVYSHSVILGITKKL